MDVDAQHDTNVFSRPFWSSFAGDGAKGKLRYSLPFQTPGEGTALLKVLNKRGQ